MDEIACQMMLEFLEKHCPIGKVKLKENDRQFTRSLIIHGAFIRGKDKAYPMNQKDKTIVSMMEDLQITLRNVFAFPNKEIAVVVSKYLELD